MQEFYAAMVDRMDTRMRTLTLPNRKLGVTLAGFYIDEDPKSRLWLDKDGRQKPEIKTDQFLKALTHWSKRRNLPEHDHAMFFTILEVFENGQKKLRGYSPQSKICSNESVSIIQERLDFSTITVATHVLAHSLGARHDGDSNPCRPEDHYIMSPKSVTLTEGSILNMWNFSSCSSNSVGQNLKRLNEENSNCLKNTPSVRRSKPHRQLGQMFDADVQCQHIFGETSYVCRSKYWSSYRGLCTGLWCSTNSGHCQKIIPADGTSCGRQKWCMNGKCVTDREAPEVADECPLRDQKNRISGTNLTCEQVSKSHQWECYQTSVAQACCYTCPMKPCDGNTCCKFDDRHSQCRNFSSYACYTPDITKLCCETCKRHCKTNIPGCACGDRRDGCSNITRLDCYTQHKECCYTCSKLRDTTHPDCEFGDRSDQCLASNCIYYDTYRQSRVCCQTCRHLHTLVATTTEVANSPPSPVDSAATGTVPLASLYWLTAQLMLTAITTSTTTTTTTASTTSMMTMMMMMMTALTITMSRPL
ncbi:A disintegrin and metalloproteinase with thrombospondin motifs 18 [Octopus bimaculoides]|nr:A disintegrin and metalloproteinase with thrombospondin motifs 18 [Octopus bimaculoides]|eukprot:XP_014777755.1 PREDICTED: A disintegrin and metalloproteinase with thrombospondin motifs 18-like [Octopus bimaculoides]